METVIQAKGRSRSRSKHLQLQKLLPFLFLLPALGLYMVFFAYPFLYSFLLSFYKRNLISDHKLFVGWNNYIHLFHDPVFWISFKNSVLYVLFTVPVTIAIGLILALFVESLVRGRSLYRLIFFLPVVSSIGVISIVWGLMFNPQIGPVNLFLRSMGIDGPNWLNQSSTALMALAIIGIWKGLGYNMVLYISGLKSIDRHLYEASSLDGANRLRQFWHITLPLLSPVTLFIAIMSVISSFQVFATIQILTQGGPNNASNVLVYQIYQESFQFFNIGVAAASSTVLFIFISSIIAAFIRFGTRKVHYQ